MDLMYFLLLPQFCCYTYISDVNKVESESKGFASLRIFFILLSSIHLILYGVKKTAFFTASPITYILTIYSLERPMLKQHF